MWTLSHFQPHFPHVFNDVIIQSHMTKMDLTPVKTAAEAKFLAYLSPRSISF